jgi:hypothetical protein
MIRDSSTYVYLYRNFVHRAHLQNGRYALSDELLLPDDRFFLVVESASLYPVIFMPLSYLHPLTGLWRWRSFLRLDTRGGNPKPLNHEPVFQVEGSSTEVWSPVSIDFSLEGRGV